MSRYSKNSNGLIEKKLAKTNNCVEVKSQEAQRSNNVTGGNTVTSNGSNQNSNNSKKSSSKSSEPSSLSRNEIDISSILKLNNLPLSAVNGSSSSTNSGSTSSNATTVFSQSMNNRIKKNKGLVNHDYCAYCDEGGDLLNCDRCPASFHLLCSEPPLNIDQIPSGEFLCNKCKLHLNLIRIL
jgi:hypothetical protein